MLRQCRWLRRKFDLHPNCGCPFGPAALYVGCPFRDDQERKSKCAQHSLRSLSESAQIKGERLCLDQQLEIIYKKH